MRTGGGKVAGVTPAALPLASNGPRGERCTLRPGETLWLDADAGVVHAFDKAGAHVNMQLGHISA